jgi:hypothetical protein
MLKQILLLAVAILVGLAIFVWVETFSSSFQTCIQQETAISLRDYARCTERFAETHNAMITALATVLLAVITLGLVWSGVEQQNTTRAQLRAYLSVIIGTAVYQERHKGLKFEAKPTILNNGQTPAYNVRYRAKADILTDSVARDYSFTEPPDILTDSVARDYSFTEPPDVPRSQSSIGPRENRLLSAILDHFVSDNEVQDIMDGNGKSPSAKFRFMTRRLRQQAALA